MKREDLTLGGMLVCLQLLFIFISKLMVGTELFLVIFLPLVSSFYTLKSSKESLVIYIISSSLLCFLFEPINTFIYIIPALIVGVSYGLLRKKQIKELSLVYITSLMHLISLFITLVSFKFFFIEFDLFNKLEQIFSTTTNNIYTIVLLILVMLSFVQSFLTHIISEAELKKFNYVVEKEETTPRWFLLGALISFVGIAVMYIVSSSFITLFVLIANVFLLPFIIEGIFKLKYKRTTLLLFIFTIFLGMHLASSLDLVFLPIVGLIILSPFTINILHFKTEKV